MLHTYDASQVDVATLDDLVQRLVRTSRRPSYRRGLLRDVPEVNGIGSLRVLRSVERHLAAGIRPTVKDVATELEIEQSTASRAVNAVVETGLVLKIVCDDDQRKMRLELTEKGRDSLARATRNRQTMLADVISDWAADDVVRLSELLQRFVDDQHRQEARERQGDG